MSISFFPLTSVDGVDKFRLLTDVTTTSLTNYDTWKYNNKSDKWEANKDIFDFFASKIVKMAEYRFNIMLASVPASGYFRSSSTLSSITEFWFHNFDNNDVDRTTELTTTSKLYIKNTKNNAYGLYEVTSITAEGNSQHVYVNHICSAGDNFVLNQTEKIEVFFNILDVNVNVTIPETHESGFDNPQNVIVLYNKNSRTINITGSNWKAYYKGTHVTSLVSGWTSEPHGTTDSVYFLYYDGIFKWTTTLWSLDTIQIAYVSYKSHGTGNMFAIRECHGLMPWQTHRHLHQSVGTYVVSGGDLSDYTLLSTDAVNKKPVISQTVIADEDLWTTLPALSDKQYSLLSIDGSGYIILQATHNSIAYGETELSYNLNTNGVWTSELFTANTYGKIYVIALPVTSDTDSQNSRYVFIQPQQTGTLSTIQNVQYNGIYFGDFEPTEYIPIAEIIVHQNSSNTWRIHSVTKITGSRQSLIATSTGLSIVQTDSSLTGNGTTLNPLTVTNQPHYLYPKFSYSGSFTFPNEIITANGTFFYDEINKNLALTLVDTSSINHEWDIRKLDYSSVIHVYNPDKTMKNRYIITQASVNQFNVPKYVIINYDSNFNEEFSYTQNEIYTFEFLLNAIQDVPDLRDATITNPINDQVLAYENGFWINKTPSSNKAFLNVGWFYDVTDSFEVSTDHYFTAIPFGNSYNLQGTGFYVDGAKNTTGIIEEILGTNICGYRNISGVQKQFLCLAKCLGRPTSGTWAALGLMTGGGIQVKKSRTQNDIGGTNACTLNSQCVVTMDHNDEIYVGGCVHNDPGVLVFNLTNIWLTIIEI